MEKIRKEQSADEAIGFGLQQLTDRGEICELNSESLFVVLNAIKEFI